ncbi:murein hydrolase activator EnvC [Pelagibius sp. Alg239-R121]|uniref:murein hydrolase activator EnvC family protein n=1 Tax=Pelagibius sp. Alg239-R121 TaxID=2993448 RepID=UPI0024A79E2B|nr:peptidoglycan DD-metalloendopeptidase family protein [Pelagibius sp. Alg239-R121]
MAGSFATKRTTAIFAIVAGVAVLVAATPLVIAQSSDLENIERDLERSKANSENLARKSEEVKLELRLLKGRMINVARKTLDLESELSDIEETIVSLEDEERAKSAALKRQRRQLGRTLGALQRIALLPPEALVAAPGSPLDAVRSATLLKVAVPALEFKADRLKQDLDELDHLRVRIERERVDVNAAGKQLSEERKTLTALINKKRRLQSRTAEQQTNSGRRMARLARDAQDLRDLIQKIEREAAERERIAHEAAQREQERRLALQLEQKQQLERERQRKVTEEQQRLAALTQSNDQAELQSRLLAPGTPPTTVESTDTASAASGQQVASAGTQQPDATALERPANIRTFPVAARNELLMPAHGRLLKRYGQQGKSGRPASKGITIATREGAQVIAPFDGKVVYAGEFRGYGLILIIEHGKRYHTLLAGVERVDAVVGQWILAGEPIGVMTGDGVHKPELYLELRRNGQAINPLPWLAATGDKVRG